MKKAVLVIEGNSAVSSTLADLLKQKKDYNVYTTFSLETAECICKDEATHPDYVVIGDGIYIPYHQKESLSKKSDCIQVSVSDYLKEVSRQSNLSTPKTVVYSEGCYNTFSMDGKKDIGTYCGDGNVPYVNRIENDANEKIINCLDGGSTHTSSCLAAYGGMHFEATGFDYDYQYQGKQKK